MFFELLQVLVFSYAEVTSSPETGINPPPISQAYFEADQFSKCVAFEFQDADYTDPKFVRRLWSISDRREELRQQFNGGKATTWQDCKETITGIADETAGIQIPGAVATLLAPVGCKMEKMGTNVYLHSIPLYPKERLKGKKPQSPNFAAKVFGLRLDQFPGYKKLSDVPNSKLLEVAKKSETEFLHANEDIKKILLDEANPLIEWMLNQPTNSIGHFDLLKKANSLYKDPFASLAIIGNLFDEERYVCGNRKRECVVGNKMKPLLPSDRVDDIGYNYRFWANLNVVLTDSASLARGANFASEWLRQKDHGDYSANEVGIQQGLSIVKHTRGLLGRFTPTRPTNNLNCSF